MRRLGLVVACLLLAVPAISLARTLPPGDGSLVVRNGRGTIVLQIKGAVIGWMARGKLTLTDNDPYDEQEPIVRAVKFSASSPKVLNDSTTVYRGRQIRYRMLDGSYKLKFEGSGIHISAVGRGWVTFDGDDRYVSDGVYSLNGDAFEPIPADRTDKIKLQIAPADKPLRETRRVNQP
jgi:hypothetical protein